MDKFDLFAVHGTLKSLLQHHSLKLSAMTCPSWVALHGIAHGFPELFKPLRHDKAVIHEGQILKLRFQYFDHLMRREDSLEKTLMLGKMEGTRRRGRHRMIRLDSVLEATGMSLAKLQEAVEDRGAWHALVHGVTKSRTRLND